MDDRTAPVAPVTATTPLPAVGETTPLPVVADTKTLPRRADRPPGHRRVVPLLLGLAALVLLGGLAFALFGGDPPSGLGSPAGSPSASPSPSRSQSPSLSSPSPPPVDSVQGAVAALQAVVAAGVEEENISEKAAKEIQDKLDDALEKFESGDTEGAIKELEDLVEKVDEMEKDEVANSEKRRLDRAIEDLAEEMLVAAPPGDGGDD